MIWYRASHHHSVNVTFSGDGGLYVAGRWNYQGRKIIYCSQSIALCTLEWLSHNGLSVSGMDYFRYSIEIPEKLIRNCLTNELPTKWNTNPATDLTRDFAETHLFASSKYLAISIPSAIVPEERNLIINPLHEKFTQVAKSIKELGQYIAPKR